MTTSKASGGQRTRAATKTGPQSRPSDVSLQLTAARAESWVEIRSGSAQGKVLFVGIMDDGSVQSFRAPSLYARFGQAGSLDARMNGAALRLPPGTYSTLITPRGLKGVPTG